MRIATSMAFIPAVSLPSHIAQPLIESGIFQQDSDKVLLAASLTPAAAPGSSIGRAVSLPAGLKLHMVRLAGTQGDTIASMADVADNFSPLLDPLEDGHPLAADGMRLGILTLKGLKQLLGPDEPSPTNAVIAVQMAATAAAIVSDLIPAAHAARSVLIAFVKRGDDVQLCIQTDEAQRMVTAPLQKLK
jgi:hypothetical protein